MTDYKKQGRLNRAHGAAFELRTRKEFEKIGWIVTKWHNNVDLQTDEITQAKNHYIPGRGLTMGKGFPDFLMFREKEVNEGGSLYQLMFVECKLNNKLCKEEKQKMQVLKNLGYNCFVAYEKDKCMIFRRFEGYEDKS